MGVWWAASTSQKDDLYDWCVWRGSDSGAKAVSTLVPPRKQSCGGDTGDSETNRAWSSRHLEKEGFLPGSWTNFQDLVRFKNWLHSQVGPSVSKLQSTSSGWRSKGVCVVTAPAGAAHTE